MRIRDDLWAVTNHAKDKIKSFESLYQYKTLSLVTIQIQNLERGNWNYLLVDQIKSGTGYEVALQ